MFPPQKRKQPSPSDPFAGIFTRSKSQIYLHCNRSGRARSDSVRRRHHYAALEWPIRNPQTSNADETSNADDISHLSIKDLRTRRVFSPASIVDECCLKASEIEGKPVFEYSNSNLEHIKLSQGTGEIDKFDSRLSCMDQNSNHINPNLLSVMNQCGSDQENAVGANCVDGKLGDGEMNKFVVGLTCRENDLDVVNHPSSARTEGEIESCSTKHDISEGVNEYVQMTPVISESGGIGEENDGISKCAAECVQTISVTGGKNGENAIGSRGVNNFSMKKENESFSRNNKLVLKLCSGRKVFKAPSSFSYRRLVPFLIDIAKENSLDPLGASNESVDLDPHCKVQNSNDINPMLCSDVEDRPSSKFDDDGGSEDRKIPNDAKYEKVEMESPCISKDLNGINPNLTQSGGNNELHCTEQKNNGDANVSNGLDELKEECVQMTPPDADIFCRPEVNDNPENREDNCLNTNGHVFEKPLNGSCITNKVCVDETFRADVDGNSSSFKSKLVLNPCSRRKVFRTLSSFSYRRLLPYLMDIDKDDSCEFKDGQRQKAQNVIEETTQQPVLPSRCQVIHNDAAKEDSFSMANHTSDREPNLITAISSPTEGLCSNELNTLSSPNITEPQIPFDSGKEGNSEVERVIINRPRKLDLADNIISVQDTALGVSHALTTYSGEEHAGSRMEISKDTKKTERVNLNQNLCPLETCVPSGILADSLKKGILKTNPRGCRGLCNCLNCASFRLHADRAFEFSRNQMQDAEEVAMDLIKELSYLRNMIKKSAVDANDNAVANINQVKSACVKASGAEEVARTRLSQMNYDLNVHCRTTCLHRPKVRFSNNVKEKGIPKQTCDQSG